MAQPPTATPPLTPVAFSSEPIGLPPGTTTVRHPRYLLVPGPMLRPTAQT